jgi:hypothetical protein
VFELGFSLLLGVAVPFRAYGEDDLVSVLLSFVPFSTQSQSSEASSD